MAALFQPQVGALKGSWNREGIKVLSWDLSAQTLAEIVLLGRNILMEEKTVVSTKGPPQSTLSKKGPDLPGAYLVTLCH